MERPLPSLVRRFWWLPGVLLPSVLIVWFSFRLTAHVPFWDQWEFVDILKHSAAHQLSFNDFWHQHNEHRIFFPRLIMFGLAKFTHWDPFWEVGVNLVLGFATLVLLLKLVFRQFDDWTRIVLASLVSWFWLSPMQWENWLWGWQIQWYLSIFGVVLAVYCLTDKVLTRRQLTGAVIGGLVATFSLANGFVVWPIGVGLLLLRQKPSRRQLVGWAAIGVLAIGAYYHGYVNPSYHPSKTLFLKEPVALIKYVLIYLGSSLGVTQRIAEVAGFSVLAGVGLATVWLWRDAKQRLATLPWIGLAGYGLLGALVTAISRLGFGVEQARSSRYTTVSVLFLIAAVALAIMVGQQVAKKRPSLGWLLVIPLGLIVLGGGSTYLHGVRAARGQHAHLQRVERCLTTVKSLDDPCLTLTYPNGPVAYQRLLFLRSHHLGGDVQLH